MIHALPDSLVAILVLLAVIFVFIFLEVFALMIGISAVKGKDTSFGNVFVTGLILIFITAVITGVVQYVIPAYTLLGTLTAIIIDMFIIQARHDTTFFGALGAIFIYVVVLIILYILLVFVFTEVSDILTDLLGFNLRELLPFNINLNLIYFF